MNDATQKIATLNLHWADLDPSSYTEKTMPEQIFTQRIYVPLFLVPTCIKSQECSCIQSQFLWFSSSVGTVTHQYKEHDKWYTGYWLHLFTLQQQPTQFLPTVSIVGLWQSLNFKKITDDGNFCKPEIQQIYRLSGLSFQCFDTVVWVAGRASSLQENWVVGCWCGCLPGARCRLAYSPADATATHCLLLQ